MCLIIFGYMVHPEYRLIVAANRDEFLDRRTAPLGWNFPDEKILGGRDLKAGGIWMGITEGGRFGAITNYRDPSHNNSLAPSRGELIPGFLRSDREPELFLEDQREPGKEYNGYNLLLADSDKLCCYSNMSEEIGLLSPGVYGLSNHLLDTPWPKVRRGKEMLEQIITGDNLVDNMLEMLADRYQPGDDLLPDTGVGIEWERLLAPLCIHGLTYGTRSSSVVLIGYDNSVKFTEQQWHHLPAGMEKGKRRAFEMGGIGL